MIPENEKPALSHKEYTALRQLFGVVSGWESKIGDLEKRLKLVPGGWRDAKMLLSVSERLLVKVLETIPVKKLAVIQKELKSTVCQIIVRDIIGDEKTCTYVSTDALERITQRAISIDCYACEKCGRDARNCKLRKDIEDLFMWDFPRVGDGEHCHFADKNLEL